MKKNNKYTPNSDIKNVHVERFADGNYNVVITGRLAEKFLLENQNLGQIKGRKVSEIEAFGELLEQAISSFELNNPKPNA